MHKPYNYKDDFCFFNHDMFNELFNKKLNREKLKIKDMEEQLAETINVSRDTVHSWRYKTYSPNGLDIVKIIANYFGCQENILLCKKKGDNKMKKLSEIELISVKKIYESIIEFLEYFYKANGFNDLWFDFKNTDPSLREDKLWKEHDKVMISLKNEYPLIGKLQVYAEISNYIYNDLYDIYDRKLSYAYRFEAVPGEDPTTYEDYTKAYKRINEIIDEYC